MNYPLCLLRLPSFNKVAEISFSSSVSTFFFFKKGSMTNISQVCLTYTDYTESPFASIVRNVTCTSFATVGFHRLFPCTPHLIFWTLTNLCGSRVLAGNPGGPGIQPFLCFNLYAYNTPVGLKKVDFGCETGNIASMWNQMKREPSNKVLNINQGEKMNAVD